MSDLSASEQPIDLLHKGEKALAIGDHKAAFANLLEAFSLEPTNRAIQISLFKILSCMEGYELPQVFRDAIAKIAEHGDHDIQALSAVVRNQFDCKDDIATLISALTNHEADKPVASELVDTIKTIFDDRLVRLILTKAIVISPELEDLMTTMRHMHLLAWASDSLAVTPASIAPELLPLIACQAFNTQYVYNATQDELDHIDALFQKVHARLPDIDLQQLSLLGCYTPLNEVFKSVSQDQIDNLTSKAEGWPQAAREMWKQQVLESRYEAEIQKTLQSFTPIPDAAPGTIREQYESFPYPRWQTATKQQSMSLAHYLGAKFQDVDFPHPPEGPIDILVAGCGTGRQVVGLVEAIENKNTLAVDISKTSLAFAYRKAQEHELENTHFALADITQIGAWDASFDLIVCTGVLHHLTYPSAGIEGLLGVSKPNTSFLLALYSKRGREAAIAAQTFIKEHGIPDSLPAIRELRSAVRGLPFHHPVAPIQDSLEFYSASGLVDYIFNRQETCYSPKELLSLLDQHGLKFLGFHDLPGLDNHRYREMFPDDPTMTNLTNWEEYEIIHPEVFGEMMQFWCCRKA